MAPTIGTHFTVGDRALYEDGWCPPDRKVVTIAGIHAETPHLDSHEITIKVNPDGPIMDTVLRLHPYKTPTFPPGITLNDPVSIYQQDEVDEFMEGLLGEEELKTLGEMNDDTLSEIMSGEARDYALYEMSTDMDDWEDIGNMKENYHHLIARSAQGNGTYLLQDPHGKTSWVNFGDCGYITDDRPHQSYGGDVLDNRDRILVEAVVNKKGHKYVKLVSKYGKVFCDLKFTKYLPNEGQTVNCVVGIRGPESKLPLKCYHIPQ
jgi:hypothetical protein